MVRAAQHFYAIPLLGVTLAGQEERAQAQRSFQAAEAEAQEAQLVLARMVERGRPALAAVPGVAARMAEVQRLALLEPQPTAQVVQVVQALGGLVVVVVRQVARRPAHRTAQEEPQEQAVVVVDRAVVQKQVLRQELGVKAQQIPQVMMVYTAQVAAAEAQVHLMALPIHQA